MASEHTWVSRKSEGDKLIAFERGDLVFVFNFHPTNSYSDYGCAPLPTCDEKCLGSYAGPLHKNEWPAACSCLLTCKRFLTPS